MKKKLDKMWTFEFYYYSVKTTLNITTYLLHAKSSFQKILGYWTKIGDSDFIDFQIKWT